MAGSTCPDGFGGVYIAWEALYAPYGTRLVRLLGSGARYPGWPAHIMLEPGYPVGVPVAMVADGAGGVYVAAYKVDYNSTPNYTVWLHHVSGAGTVLWSELLGEFILTDQTPSVLAMFRPDPDDVMVVYADRREGEAQTRIEARRYTPDGNPADGWPRPSFHVSNVPIAIYRAVPDGAGGFYLAWGSGTVRATRVLGDGTIADGWPAGFRHVIDPAPYGGTYAIARGEDNGLLVAFEDSQERVRLRSWTAAGEPDPDHPADGLAVSPTNLRASASAVLGDGGEGAFVAWRDDTNDFDRWLYLRLSYVKPPLSTGAPPAVGDRLALAPPSPNPTSDDVALRLVLPDASAARIEMMDVTGRRVREHTVQGAGEHHVRFTDLHALAPGVYVVRLAHAGGVRTARLVVAR
jgi:hypothetical protein